MMEEIVTDWGKGIYSTLYVIWLELYADENSLSYGLSKHELCMCFNN